MAVRNSLENQYSLDESCGGLLDWQLRLILIQTRQQGRNRWFGPVWPSFIWGCLKTWFPDTIPLNPKDCDGLLSSSSPLNGSPANSATAPWHRLSMQRSVRRPQTISRPSRSTSLRSNLRGIRRRVQLPWNLLILYIWASFVKELPQIIMKSAITKLQLPDEERIRVIMRLDCLDCGVELNQCWNTMAAMMLAESGVVLGSSTLTSFLSKTSSCRPSHLGTNCLDVLIAGSQVWPRVWWFGQKKLWDHWMKSVEQCREVVDCFDHRSIRPAVCGDEGIGRY